MRLVALLAVCVAGQTLAACASHGSQSTPPTEAVESTGSPSLTYLGAAGWSVSSGSHTLLLDPYFSRDPVADANRPLVPDAVAIARHSPTRAEVILVGHSHYDHLLDVPTIAARTRAIVVGSPSTLNVARAAGLPEARVRLAEPGKPLALGAFSVLPLASLHSLTGEAFGTIGPNVKLPMAAKDYAEGTTLAYLVTVQGRSILFMDSANFIEASLLGVHPDVAVVATALRERVADYTCRLMKDLGYPMLVFPNHFDAHWQPFVGKESHVEPDQRADLRKFSEEARSCSPKTRVIIPDSFQTFTL